MAKASVKIFKDGNLIAETDIKNNSTTDINDATIDEWTDFFRTNNLTLTSLKIKNWDTIQFDADVTIYTRN